MASHTAASVMIVLLSIMQTLAFSTPLSYGTPLPAASNRPAVSKHFLRTTLVRCEDDVVDWGVDNLFEMMEDADEKIGGIDAFLAIVASDPKTIDFEQTMAAIEDGYEYTAKPFKCGELESTAEQNQGSAKIFSFAKMQKLNKEKTLALFGRFYREDVLQNADGSDHGNIRNFMKAGWDGVSFPDGLALAKK
jgi:hypothetical protein